jgi:hypothetical protein
MYGKNAPKATVGPYTGLYMSEDQHRRYINSINDLNLIKEISGNDDPVLFATYSNWMYLYVERPMATYTTWYRGSLNFELLKAYYKENPKKIPKYIYIDSPEPENVNTQFIDHMFDYTRQNLSGGVLLTVEQKKF